MISFQNVLAETSFDDGLSSNKTVTLMPSPRREKEEDSDLKNLSGDAKCTTKFWRCIGSVVMGGAHYLQEPGGVTE